MSRRLWPAAGLVLLAAIACSDNEASGPTMPADEPTAALAKGPDQAKLEILARRFAVALADDAFRLDLKAQLDASPIVEHKLHFRTFLQGRGRAALRQVAAANRMNEVQLEADMDAAIPVEIYLPVAEHRARWTGDQNILVATALDDGDAPVAFNTRGKRFVLDPDRPPATPVLALVPVETSFTRTATAQCLDCDPPPPGGGGGGGGGSGNLLIRDLTLTYAQFNKDFEGWLKGKPEFEIHIMGPAARGDTTKLKSYQCIGEHAPPGYTWDMNSLTWTGAARLYTAAQMDAFEQANPGTAFLVFVLEDDDAACEIRTDEDRSGAVLKALGQVYKDYKAAKDQKVLTPTGATRILTAAKSAADFLSALHSFLNSNDDIVGFAVENGVTGLSHPVANWAVLDESKQNGWVKLEMR